VLGRILLPRLAEGARILDLCCGPATLARQLAAQGFRMTGVDASDELLRFARKECPQGEFICADAREFHRPEEFHAAISTFDSMNHILESADLVRVFMNVYESLVPEGLFVFDLLTDEAFRKSWNETAATVEPDHAIIVRGTWDAQHRLGRTDITTFRYAGEWLRADSTVTERCYSQPEGRTLLTAAGFRDIEIHTEPGGWGEGRVWFVARK
jgi:SAM-dependent methyltransferase